MIGWYVVKVRRSCTHSQARDGEGLQLLFLFLFKCFVLHFSNDLMVPAYWNSCEGRKKLFFLYKVKFSMAPYILFYFYRCNMESILSGCIMTWYRGCSCEIIICKKLIITGHPWQTMPEQCLENYKGQQTQDRPCFSCCHLGKANKYAGLHRLLSLGRTFIFPPPSEW